MNNHDIIKIPIPIVKTHKHWREVPSFPSVLRAGPSGRSPFISLTLRRPLRLKCDYRAVPAGSSASDRGVFDEGQNALPGCDLTGPPLVRSLRR